MPVLKCINGAVSEPVQRRHHLKPGELIKIRIKDPDPEVPNILKHACHRGGVDFSTVTAVVTYLDKSNLQATGGVGELGETGSFNSTPL